MHLSTFAVSCAILIYLLLVAVVQWDNSGVRFKTALLNTFYHPLVYLIMVPIYYAVKAGILAKEWILITMYHPNTKENNHHE
jgi:hypothetical protein